MSDIVTKKGETAAQLLKRAEEWMALMPMQSPGPQHLVLDLADALRAHISLVEKQLDNNVELIRRIGRLHAALEPFGRNAKAVSLSDALGHIEREHMLAAAALTSTERSGS